MIQPKAYAPFRYMGGKNMLFDYLVPPNEGLPFTFNKYYEPFLGSGAFFFKLVQNDMINERHRIYLNDIRSELIEAFLLIKNYPKSISREMVKLWKTHCQKQFYKIRNILHNQENELNDKQIGLAFMYLQKYSVMGLGNHTVVDSTRIRGGRDKHAPNCDNYLAVSKVLNGYNVEFSCNSFRKIPITQKSFYYFDPPYWRASTPYGYKSESKSFNLQDQYDLKKMCDKIDKVGSKFLLSNSNTEMMQYLFKYYNMWTFKGTSTNYHPPGNKPSHKWSADSHPELMVRNY